MSSGRTGPPPPLGSNRCPAAYHQEVPGDDDRVHGARDEDGALPLGAAGVREVNGGPRALHDLLDVQPAASAHELVVLGRDLDLGAHREGHLRQRAG